MDLATAEREKYERMWADPAYRTQAPGEHLVDDAISRLGMEPGRTIVDFGCGTGRPAAAFEARGFIVTAVDHAENCLDPELDVETFMQECLWDRDFPLGMAATYGFCTDVMEHIPPEKVDAVLGNICQIVSEGVYFQIATRPDVMGKRIGQPLHLTVEPAEWWGERLRQFWSNVVVEPNNGGLIATCRS